MGLPLGHARHQGPVIAGLGRVALAALAQRFDRGPRGAFEVPSPEHRARVPARDRQMVDDYVRWCGGDPASWRGRLPPHLFPQWGFPLLGRTLAGIPYPIARVLNGGCRMEIRGDLPAGEPLDLTARLVRVDEDARRAILHQELVTSVGGVDLLVAQVQGVVPLSKGKDEQRSKKSPVLVPTDAREIGWWRLAPDAGLAFACLTGDFNPVHWIRPYARASGFKGTILHGFATLGRALEALQRVCWAGDTRRLRTVEVRFTRPLLLPARVGCYLRGHEIFVGDAPGAPAYLQGTFEVKDETHE